MSSVDRRAFLGTSLAGAGAAWSSTRSAHAAEPASLATIGKTPHTKFAVNVEMWWRKLPFMERFAKAAELGYRDFVGLECNPTEELAAARAVAAADVW